MNLEEIKQAINNGFKVYWKQRNYVVIKDSIGQYLICCVSNNHCIGLTWQDGVTMNESESDFYIGEES